MRRVQIEPTYDAWRSAALGLLEQRIHPSQVAWYIENETSTDLFTEASSDAPTNTATVGLKLPPALAELAQTVIYHRDEMRFHLLYSLLWRVRHENKNLLHITTDDEVAAASRMASQVKRDEHRMHAFVRFRKQFRDGDDFYVAWHRPDHLILRLAVPFFVERFRPMKWSILTPEESAHWDTNEIKYGPGVRHEPTSPDEWESTWQTYYRSTFNPARVNEKLLRQHVPLRFRQPLPEASTIGDLLAQADDRARGMIEFQPVSARSFFPATITLDSLKESAKACRACPLYANATNLVFGEGPPNAEMAILGEQPGDEEDKAGRGFVGPSGQLVNRALAEAGIQRERVYISGAVKHFKHEVKFGRRLHRTPNSQEIAACRPWLLEEMKIVRPKVMVCMGVTAAQAILGRKITLRNERSRWINSPYCDRTIITNHPAAILRTLDPQEREDAYRKFVEDLTKAQTELRNLRNAEPECIDSSLRFPAVPSN